MMNDDDIFPSPGGPPGALGGPRRMSVIAWESTKGVWKRTHLRGRSQRHSTRRVQAAGKSRRLENPISGTKCCNMFQIYYLWAHVIVGYTLHACLDFLLHVIYLGTSSEPFRVVQIKARRDVLQSSCFCLACQHTNVRRPFDPANPIHKKNDPQNPFFFHTARPSASFSGTPNLALCEKSDLAKWPVNCQWIRVGHSGPWFQEKRIGSGKDLQKSSGIHVYSHLSDHLPSELRYKPAWEVMLCLLPFRSRSAKKTKTHQEDAGEKLRILEFTWRHEGNCWEWMPSDNPT